MTQDYTHELIASTPHLPIFSSIYEDPKQLVPSHWHNHIEILFPLEGTLYISIHEQEYAIKQHDVFIVNANDIHSTRSIDYVKVFMLQIPYDYIAVFIANFPYVRFHEHLDQLALKNHTAFIALRSELAQLADIFSHKTYGYEFDFMSHLHRSLHIIYLHFSTRLQDLPKEPNHIARLKEALTYIGEHYMESISLGTAASIAALNQEYFCRIFKKYTGTTFLEYVNLIRLTHIYEELTTTDDTVTDILERNGFTNYKVFSRMFKNNYGTTPAALRKNMKII